jgi:hypothetical protein
MNRRFLQEVFAQLCRIVQPKRVKDQLDAQFHPYLPASCHHQQTLTTSSGTFPSAQSIEDSPVAQIINDALVARETPEQLLEKI